MDHDKLNELQRQVQDLLSKVMEQSSQITKLWGELIGLRETLENIEQR